MQNTSENTISGAFLKQGSDVTLWLTGLIFSQFIAGGTTSLTTTSTVHVEATSVYLAKQKGTCRGLMMPYTSRQRRCTWPSKREHAEVK